MEWNWFFSALAQSMAAVVGLMGAFVFTKVVNNQGAFAAKREERQQLLLTAKYLQHRARDRYFEWYNERKRATAIRDLRQLLQDSEPPWDPDELYEELPFSPFDPKEDVRSLISRELEQYQPPPPRGIPDYSAILATPNPRQYQLEDKVQEERERRLTPCLLMFEHTLSASRKCWHRVARVPIGRRS